MKVPFIGRSKKGSYRRIGKQYLFDRLPYNFIPQEDLPSAIQRVGDAMVRVDACDEHGHEYRGMGLNLGGFVLTALHTVQDSTDINLSHEERRIGAREVARDEDLDLALLEPENSLPAPSVALSAESGLGDGELYVFGYLFFIEAREGRSATYKERLCAYRIQDIASRYIKDDVLTVAIPAWAYDLFPGFSGSMLVDGQGSIRGMVQMTIKDKYRIYGVIPFHFAHYIGGPHSHKLQDFLFSPTYPHPLLYIQLGETSLPQSLL